MQNSYIFACPETLVPLTQGSTLVIGSQPERSKKRPRNVFEGSEVSPRRVCAKKSLSQYPTQESVRAKATDPEGNRKVVKQLPHLPLYAQETYCALRVNEDQNWSESCGFYKVQKDINLKMREVLVSWMCDVVNEFGLTLQTLFLAVKYLDRFLSKVPVVPQTLQLVGVTCILIASKYEEIACPSVVDLVNITDNTYTCAEILKTELIILTHLNFKLTNSTTQHFINYLMKLGNINTDKMVHLVNYLAELTMLCYPMQQNYKPSKIAASIVYLVCHNFQPELIPLLETYSDYSQMKLRLCLKDIYSLHKKMSHPSLKSEVKKKFMTEEYSCVVQCPLKLDLA